MKRTLFICTHNSARSQIAEGILNHLYPLKYRAFSAGTEKTSVNPLAIKVMKEIGIDISNQSSKLLDSFINEEWDYIITVCDNANETCPVFPGGKNRLHKSFKDPSSYQGTIEEKTEFFRKIRDEIYIWIKDFFDNN